MTKEVIISINGMHRSDGDMVIDKTHMGNYYLKDGVHYVFFEEVSDDGSMYKNSVRISESKVEVSKKGDVSYRMIFEASKNNVSYYHTPFGTMEVHIFTENIEIKEEESSIGVKVDYALEIDGEHMADCKAAIEISSKK